MWIKYMRFKELVKRVPGAQEFVREQRCNLLALRSYLDGSLASRENVHWLLVLTFPNGGSTALAKLLLTAPNTVALTSNAEGQWLIPSLCKAGARWDKEHLVWQRKIRAVWLNQITTNDAAQILVVEKSPPNMCRYRSLLAALRPMQTYVATFARDPYATCASWHRRYGIEAILRNWYPSAGAVGRNETDYFRFLGQIWLDRAKMLLAARTDSIINIRYEDLTNEVGEVTRNLAAAVPHLSGISPTAKVKVKDYGEQGMINI